MHQYKNVLHVPSLAFNKPALLRFMVVSLFALMMLDNVLTYVGVAYLNGIEGNVLCTYLGLNTFIALKMVTATALPLAVNMIGKTQFGITAAACIPLNLTYAGMAVNNVIMLGLVG